MGNFELIGRGLVVAGIALAVVGGLVWVLGRFAHLDRLPGTLRIEGSGVTCVFPILACIVLSVLLTIALNLGSHWINH
jgi:hypothetical protein